MTDADDSQSSVSDYFEDGRDLVCTEEEDQLPTHDAAVGRSAQLGSAREGATSEDSSCALGARGTSATCFTQSAKASLESSDSESSPCSSGSLYQPECNTASRRKVTTRRSARNLSRSPANRQDSARQDSLTATPHSDLGCGKESKSSGLPKSSLDLKAIFAHHFRGKKLKSEANRRFKERKQRTKKKYESTRRPRRRLLQTMSREERKERLLGRGFQFPFVEKHYGRKHIPLKMVFEYEHAALKGYFQYIEMLKYEDHLKKALKNLNASEDFESKCVAMRRHRYLDDEGPISPIQDTNEDNLDSDDQEEYDAKIVDNSCFILSSKLPIKEKNPDKPKSGMQN
ncbi:TATA box-binding protein-associated factor RNA polymerase I subunit D isoform X1 [Alligator sinensis]|uniref:TATA box-binding protein-associated factor RNA polymerase I subunit D n=1 Tax=Alligator sinensis TaxID=38654 RepID=A0A1U8CY07_ALLSI|nr:TATA box-binding protein-associated factor RNA polymerase I subunit D isoform X1 [Alligator sinensis]XP_025053674.1 TATA box-binding protein-associated factor RNA polymerase I subunit D isoform X1 [Alligator sinensis]XP_025053675.1 TATA box-binding protein-associated factor RNA polymerase I subunit D isoform X1 [Alligator sinensis]